MLCLMFAIAESDAKLGNDELTDIVTMRNIFTDYAEQDIISLYKEYKNRFKNKGFSEISSVMVGQIPDELRIGTLSILADIAVTDFNIDKKEGAFFSIVAHAMGITDLAMKTLLMAALSKKLLMDVSK